MTVTSLTIMTIIFRKLFIKPPDDEYYTLSRGPSDNLPAENRTFQTEAPTKPEAEN